MKYEITGEVLMVGDTVTLGNNGYQKRSVILRSGTEEYPRGIPVDFHKANISMVDGVNAGDMVKIEFFVDGSPDRREQGNARFYASLRGCSLTVTAKSTVAPIVSFRDVFEAWKGKDPNASADDFRNFCLTNAKAEMEQAAAAGKKFSQVADAETCKRLLELITGGTVEAENDDIPF